MSLDSDRLDESSTHDVSTGLPGGSTLLACSTPQPSNDLSHRVPSMYSEASPGQLKRTAEFISGSPAGWWDTMRTNHQSGISSSRPPSVFSEPVLHEPGRFSNASPHSQQADINRSFTSAWSEPVFRDPRMQHRSSSQSDFLQRTRAPPSVWSEPAFIKGETTFPTGRLNEELDNEFDSISLGPLIATTLKRTDSGMFSTMSTWSGQRSWTSASIPQSLQQRRPLISPAKLNVLEFRCSTPTGFTGSCFSPKPDLSSRGPRQRSLFSDSASVASDQFSVYREPSGKGLRRLSLQDPWSKTDPCQKDEDFDTSRSSRGSRESFCPVDSTTNEAGKPVHAGKTGDQWWRNGWTVGAVLVFSVLTNMIMVLTSVFKS